MKEKEFISDFNRLIEKYWQLIVIIVAIVVLFIFIGYYILKNGRWEFYMNLEKDNYMETGADIEAKADSYCDSVADEDTNKKTKRAYLTFDDGPSENTMELLDVLDEYNVKATFFVIGREEKYYDYYREIVKRGHVLALHSYTHDYEVIYASKDNFIRDIEELRNLLYDVTGVKPVYYRFPGGSTNPACKIPVEELIAYLDEQGLVYFDWNSLSNDAVCKELSPSQLVDNIMKDAVNQDDAVILMHDLKQVHATIESLPMLIESLRNEGYELLPISEDTPVARLKIN